ncbi:hypothetical protein CEP54_009080 [Fusarium duplospermum]|uniref:Mitotic apparatus protein p62 n=1 Tax=Fusarium duplospermum TaxID=1325734 RepID=A0A428PSF5_9HYPO|nr:hypothetical protein CEP54_009080 [Fusarium duplospermum]
MAPIRVLRFARSDDKSAFVLVQVTPKGSKPLDLELVGTEGEAPYVASLKHDRVVSLRVKNCPASEDEWQSILEALFQQEPVPDIQATATVQSDKSISITIRKEIQGITQRLGAVALNYDPDEAIELFEWCGAAVESSATSKQAVADLTVKSADSEAAVAQLQSQLEELLRAKDEDETALLRKFRDLLNEKKVKIREQQQVLASTTFNASMPGHSQPSESVEIKVEEPEPKRPKKPVRKAGKSRASKRKAPASKRVEESEEEDMQSMDVDIKEEPEDTDPGNTTEATASVSGDDEDDAEVLSSSSQQRAVSEPAAPQEEAPPQVSQPPPRRELPFALRKKSAKPAPPPAGSDTDSDDEL